MAAVLERIHQGVVPQLVKSQADPAAQEGPVGVKFRGFGLAGLEAIRPDPFSVNIRCEGHVTQLGQLLGPPLDVMSQAVPLVNHQDPRPFALDGIVVSQVTFEDRVAVLVINGLGDHFRLGETQRHAKQQNRGKPFPHTSLQLLKLSFYNQGLPSKTSADFFSGSRSVFPFDTAGVPPKVSCEVWRPPFRQTNNHYLLIVYSPKYLTFHFHTFL